MEPSCLRLTLLDGETILFDAASDPDQIKTSIKPRRMLIWLALLGVTAFVIWRFWPALSGLLTGPLTEEDQYTLLFAGLFVAGLIWHFAGEFFGLKSAPAPEQHRLVVTNRRILTLTDAETVLQDLPLKQTGRVRVASHEGFANVLIIRPPVWNPLQDLFWFPCLPDPHSAKAAIEQAKQQQKDA